MSQRRITFSPAFTLVPTYECFNRCSYCNFRAEPGQHDWLTLEEAKQRLKRLRPAVEGSPARAFKPSGLRLSQKSLGESQTSITSLSEQSISGHGVESTVAEILILSGEVHPKSQRRSLWFQRIYDLCQLSLDLGFLPHTNAGPLSFSEMEQIKAVNVSMGLMLEQMTPKLLETVHRHAPSKVPEQRLEQLDWAGQLKIPFTTGLLLGIGETERDRIETLETIAQCHERWGHIQEVILQPHSPGRRQIFSATACPADVFIKTVALAREILPGAIAIQIPPNLAQTPEILLACLEAGARDLGGISPIDEVNPDYAHPLADRLASQLAEAGWELAPRLPVHGQYLPWLTPQLRDRCLAVLAAWQAGRD